MVITGVIRPPPEIRAVADKTALFVAKNGRAFESRILNSEKGKTPKFAFLHSSSPFHAYYEDKIRFYEEGGEEKENDGQAEKELQEKKKQEEEKKVKEAQEKKKQEEIRKKKEKAQKASALDPVATALLSRRKVIKEAREADEEAKKSEEPVTIATGVIPPPKMHFVTVAAPAHLSPVQIETIKLVAQFTALDGKGGPFFQQLTNREWSNPLFAFIQPRHGHFAYFSALVDSYRIMMSTWTNKDRASDTSILPVAELAGNVDKCLEVAAYRAEYDRDIAERRRQEMEGNELSGAANVDWYDFVVVETIDFPADEVVSMLPPPPAPSMPAAVAKTVDEMEESDDEGETIRVVPEYTPKVVSTQYVAQETSRTHVIDPITGKSVPLADLPEHMRIQLLDPKWAEEKKKFIDKQKESNLVRGDMIASNISRFAQAKGGMFGSTEEQILSSQVDSKKRQDEANRIIREQAQQARTAEVGPALPPPPVPPGQSLPPPLLPPPSHTSITTVPAPPPVVPPPSTIDASAPPPKRPRMEAPVDLPPVQMQAVGDAAQPAILPPQEAVPPPVVEPEETPEILPEAEFIASLSDTSVSLSIQIPNDSSNSAWNFNGQIVSLSVDVTSKIKLIKEELKSHLGGMPVNKIQLKSSNAGFLKDSATLAQLNIGPSAELDMVPKTRGGRK
mmetsp:Transcript_29137/g.40781  ORF Transcript_29137/g.40781 Transcript_29137/m.40781 type:complete len:676 (+) Transcript_29137:122-2149(+)